MKQRDFSCQGASILEKLKKKKKEDFDSFVAQRGKKLRSWQDSRPNPHFNRGFESEMPHMSSFCIATDCFVCAAH